MYFCYTWGGGRRGVQLSLIGLSPLLLYIHSPYFIYSYILIKLSYIFSSTQSGVYILFWNHSPPPLQKISWSPHFYYLLLNFFLGLPCMGGGGREVFWNLHPKLSNLVPKQGVFEWKNTMTDVYIFKVNNVGRTFVPSFI